MSDYSKIKKYTPVFTSDGEALGEALALYHRQEDVNPKLKLYETYLEIYSLEMGNSSYVPTEFVALPAADAESVELTVAISTFAKETWDRTPDFVAGHRGKKEELPSGEQAALI